MKPTYEFEHTEILCPFCVNRILGRWFVNSQVNIGERCVNVDIHAGGVPAEMTNKVFGQYMVPTSVLMEQEVFMGRTVWRSKIVAIGAYDDYGSYKFKKEIFKIQEV